MTIGLIADTHGYLDPKISSYFSACDEIWHAGDIGSVKVLESLEQIATTKAVYGNIDGQDIRIMCPEDLIITKEGIKVLLTHIAGTPGKYNSRVKSIIRHQNPDLIVCGHSHILKVTRDPVISGLLYINPGAAGRHGFHHQKTIIRMSLENGSVTNLEVIELGKRGSI
ncbi:MAG: phosphoesterase [Cyclobacteriaceae bacterium]|nr:MAG: phosphoesterase [Cyclobacteriaceae bacterium]